MTLIATNPGLPAPRQPAESWLPVRMLYRTIAVLTGQLHRERIDRTRVENEFEGQRLQTEARLLRVARQVVDLKQQLKDQTNRANGLEARLAAAQNHERALGRLLIEAQGSEARAIALQNDIGRQLASAKTRIAQLEGQIVSERTKHQKDMAMMRLKMRHAELSKELEGDQDIRRIWAINSSVFGPAIGFLAGGPLGMALGLLGGAAIGGAINVYHLVCGGEYAREEERRIIGDQMKKI